MTEREILLKKISTYQFSILDLQIFLDTHPYDQQVLSQIKECKEKLIKRTTFGTPRQTFFFILSI